MKDFYAIFGVHPEASTKEIKSAFRKRAKAKHPDTGAADDQDMRLLLEAYRVLSNPQARREYDRGRLRLIPNAERDMFDYRVWLKERLDEPEYVAKLVFYDLLHHLEDEALELYERIRETDEGRLERFFERPEAMDAEFCIAEEYAARGRFVDAYAVMRKLIGMEQRAAGFGYFYDIVLQRFRRLVLADLAQVLEPEALLDTLSDAIDARSSADNDAQFLRKRAEILYGLGRVPEARAAVARAATLDPGMPGLRVLARKIAKGMQRIGAP